LAVKLHLPKTYATSLLFNEDFFQVVTNMRIVAVADAVDSGVPPVCFPSSTTTTGLPCKEDREGIKNPWD
jgi:hypothetical protein